MGYPTEPITRLLEGTARVTGEAFFAALTSTVTRVFGVRHCLVGKHVAGDSFVEVMSWCEDGVHRAPIRYAIAGTPCARAIEHTVFRVESDVRAIFPSFDVLSVLGIESYLGLPMIDGSGVLRGVLVAMHDEPLTNLDAIEVALRFFADRAAAELVRISIEGELADRELRLSQILEGMSDGVWEIDADANTTFVNSRMEQMLGLPLGTMLGRSLFDFMSEGAKAIAAKNVERRERGIAERHDFPLLRADGTILATVMATSPLYAADGRYRGALAVVKDLSHERAVERRLSDAQRLEGLELLAAGVAHDFNNVLGAILAHVHRARRSVVDGSVASDSLDQIDRAVEGAAGLTRRLRAYAGAPTMGMERLDLGRIVEELCLVLAPTLSAGISLERSVSPNASILGDRTSIEQLVLNLVTNARDAVAMRGGSIRIRVRRLRFGARDLDTSRITHDLPPGDQLVLSVEDDGPGMDETLAARMFDPFFSTKGGGRGLGLSIVRGVAKSHGAALFVETKPGRGTQFVVAFRPSADSDTGTSTTSAAQTFEPLRLLVVDDEEALRAGIVACLRDAGHHVDEAVSGNHALSILRAKRYELDAVLMDVNMPDGDGLSTLRAIRRASHTIPVVLMSGAANAEVVRLAEEDRMLTLLVKPFQPNELVVAASRLRLGTSPSEG